MRADRPNFGPGSSASHASHFRFHNLAPQSPLTAIGGGISTCRREGEGMSTSVAIADWIKRIADDERRRDAVRVKDDELAARKADVVRRNRRRPVHERRAAVARYAAAFREEVAGDKARDAIGVAEAPDVGAP